MQQQQFNEAQYLAQVLQNSKEFTCASCSGKFFKQVVIIRKVSKLLTGMDRDGLIPIPMFRCDDCGTPVEELSPEIESKPTPPPSQLITD